MANVKFFPNRTFVRLAYRIKQRHVCYQDYTKNICSYVVFENTSFAEAAHFLQIQTPPLSLREQRNTEKKTGSVT